MEKRKVFFIDKEGKYIHDDEIDGHEQLAEKLLNENDELREKFEKSKIDSKVLFFILKEKYCAGSEYGMYRDISFIPPVSERVRNLLAYYHDEGYKLTNILKEYENAIGNIEDKEDTDEQER